MIPCRRALVTAAMLALLAFGQEPAVVVNSAPLVMTTPPLRIGDELFVPLGPIARALNAELTVAYDQTFRLRRNDGTIFIYDGRTGEIRTGGVLAGQVRNSTLIHLSPEVDQLLFPLSAIPPLFSVNIRNDDQRNILYIDSVSGPGSAAPGAGDFSLTDASYHYGLTTNGLELGQNLNLYAQALAGSRMLTGQIQATHIPNGQAIYLNQAAFRADLSPSRAVFFGDQSAYTGIDALSSSIRGIGLEQKLRGGYTAYVYGGVAVGSTAGSVAGSLPHYDTRLGGLALRRTGQGRSFGVGMSAFQSSRRKGALFGLGFGQRIARNLFNIQLAGGLFSGQSLYTEAMSPSKEQAGFPPQTPDGVAPSANPTNALTPAEDVRYIAVRGPAYGFTASDVFLPMPQISISGQWDYYSDNFLAPRQDTRFNAASGGTTSLSVRPFHLLTLNASAGDREFLLVRNSEVRSYSYGGTFIIPGSQSPQIGYMHSQQLDSASAAGRFSMNQYSALLPRWQRYSASVYYSEIAVGATRFSDLNTLWSVDTYRYGRFGVRYESQFGSNERYGADWYLKLGEHDGYLRLGADRLRVYRGGSGIAPVLGARVPLPKGQVLEVSYVRDMNTQLLQVQFGGKLMRPHEILRDSRGTPRTDVRTAVAGQVYIDANYNGHFDAGERGVADVQVWIDSKRMASTDSRGNYRFDNLEPGTHELRANLAGVPAGFVLAGGSGSNMVNAIPGLENRMDFPVIRTGRIQGQVVLLDYAEDVDNPKEVPLPDVRVVATGDIDTFTEANGTFLLGDLAPGRYELHLDPSSVPKGYVAQPASYSVTVAPGAVVSQPRFRLVIPPKPVIQMRAPDQKLQLNQDERQR